MPTIAASGWNQVLLFLKFGDVLVYRGDKHSGERGIVSLGA